MRILGIETSCDDTCGAVVCDGAVLSSVVSSQHEFHLAYGGVVPEIAARQHSRLIVPVLEEALRRSGSEWSDLHGVAVTVAPGLIGALLVGVAAAKGIALSLEIPLIPVNHLVAHVETAFLSHPELPVPHVSLLVSGGHTVLFFVGGRGEALVMGSTLDDAAGEALDKAAHLLGLGYPGGPALDACAATGNPSAIPFPRPRARSGDFDFSFSGLKTALAVHVQRQGLPTSAEETADLAASYLEAVVDVLVHKTIQAAAVAGVRAVTVVGGVAANRRLRQAMRAGCEEHGLSLFIPAIGLCTDNAAMVAAVGENAARDGRAGTLQLDASASVPMRRWAESGRGTVSMARGEGA